MLYNEIALIGYSGHGLVVGEAAILSKLPLKYYVEKNIATFNLFNLEYLGYDGEDNFIGWKKNIDYVLGVGDNNARFAIGERIKRRGKNILNVIHPTAILSRYMDVGAGNYIAQNVVVNTAAKVGNYCILNTGAIIEHECKLGEAVHIAPGAVLTGNVSVGDCSFIGANAVIRQGINIGRNVVIGAGAVIVKDVEDGHTVVGNPGRTI